MVKGLIFSILLSISSICIPSANQFQDEKPFTSEQLSKMDDLIKSVKKKDLKSLDGGKLYKQNCTACHGRKGGLGISGATNLKKSTAKLNERVAMIFYGKGKMTAYEGALENAEMVAIAKYLKELRT